MNGKLFICSTLAAVFTLAQTSFSAEWMPAAGSSITELGENPSPPNPDNSPKVSAAGRPKEQPNFIVILTDDQGWGTTSVTVDPAVPESKSDFFENSESGKAGESGAALHAGLFRPPQLLAFACRAIDRAQPRRTALYRHLRT